MILADIGWDNVHLWVSPSAARVRAAVHPLHTDIVLVAVSGSSSVDIDFDLLSGPPRLGANTGPSLTSRLRQQRMTSFATSAAAAFISGVPAFNVELKGNSLHLRLPRA